MHVRKLTVVFIALAAGLVLLVGSAGAITSGQPDGNEHPYVGQLFFFVPDEIDPRFTDPGTWFSCSGTLISPTVVLTAGHCTHAIGLDGESTTEGGGNGNGGNDVWVTFSEIADYVGIPPSSDYIPDGNAQRYEDRVVWLNANPAWHRGTAYSHPDFDNNAFLLHDLGVVILDEPVSMSENGLLPTLGYLDQFLSSPRNDQRFTPVGYGLQFIRPTKIEFGDVRLKADVQLVSLKGTFGIPEGTAVVFSHNNGKTHQGGACLGDSGGPVFDAGTRTIVAVTSFGVNPNCTGTDGAYRVDQSDDLNWLAVVLD